jgi:hypothetical protein
VILKWEVDFFYPTLNDVREVQKRKKRKPEIYENISDDRGWQNLLNGFKELFERHGLEFCPCCEETLHLSSFKLNKSRSRGVSVTCLQCGSKATKSQYKWCVSCRTWKTRNNFYAASKSTDGLHAFCLECHQISQDKYYSKNPMKATERHFKRTYGISLEEYDSLLEKQGGVCAICHQPEEMMQNNTLKKPKRLAVDHCHTTGMVRGLLCTKCNQGLGNFRDDTGFMTQAISYLEKSKK